MELPQPLHSVEPRSTEQIAAAARAVQANVVTLRVALERRSAPGFDSARGRFCAGILAGRGFSDIIAQLLNFTVTSHHLPAWLIFSVIACGLLVPTLLEKGSEAQKQKFIPPTIRGEMVWAQGYSEPGAGSDLASLRTSAVLDGDDWMVNGQKIWTSTAHVADWIFCLVRTEPEAPKHQGISFLLFRMDTPGIEVRPLIDMTGNHNFNEVFFTDVRVPKDQIVGKRGQGWQVANAILGHERDSLGDPNATLSRLNALVDLMKTETVDGAPVIDNGVYRDRLMKIQARVMAMRFNDMRVLSSRLNPGQDATLARMITKLQGTELRHELEGLAVDIMGEVGLSYEDNPYTRGHGSWQQQYMFFLGLIIGGGTSQIQKNIISERGLGMPREPKVQIDK